LTVFAIWLKLTANSGLRRFVGLLCLALGLASCADQSVVSPTELQGSPPVLQQPPKGSAPLLKTPPLGFVDAGLKPLPTAQQVKDAVLSGRADPFSPLPNTGSTASTTDATLNAGPSVVGVLTVGTQTRALLSFGTGRGEICVGPRGRCSQDHPLVLPEGWSVLRIDAQKGCVQLAENGKAQDLLCIA